MKHNLFLSLFFLFAGLSAMAQPAVKYQQEFTHYVETFVIQAGWDVTLVHSDHHSPTLTVDAPQNRMSSTLDSTLFDYDSKTHTLTINSTLSMRGASLVIENNFYNRTIILSSGATVHASDLILGGKNGIIKLEPGSMLEVSKITSRDDVSVEIKGASLSVGELAGQSIYVDIWGDSHVKFDQFNQADLSVELEKGHAEKCLEFPSHVALASYSAVPKYWEDTIQHITLFDSEERIWDATLKVSMGFFARGSLACGYSSVLGRPVLTTSPHPVLATSPYFDKFQCGILFDAKTEFYLKPRLSLVTGLRYELDWTPLWHNVSVDEQGLLVLADNDPSQLGSLATSSYLGIPVELYWHPKKNAHISYGVDLFAGYCMSGHVRQFFSPGDYAGMTTLREKCYYLNPVKLELGLVLYHNATALPNRWRLYVNLLPEYRVPQLPKIHAMGLEIQL